MDPRRDELRILLKKLLINAIPNSVIRDTACNFQIEKAMDDHLLAAFGPLSASITRHMANYVAAIDKLNSDARDAQREVLVECMEKCREECDDDVGAIQSNLPHFLLENGDDIFTT
jgi:hypothetical protein